MYSSSDDSSETVCRRVDLRDLPAIVAVHCAAFPHTLLTAFGEKCVAEFYRWHLEGEHAVATIGVEREGVLVGFCVLLWRSDLSGFFRKALSAIAWKLLRTPSLVLRPEFGSRVRGSLGLGRRRGGAPVPATSMRILSIAVSPSFQGKGYGQRLLEAASEIARDKDATTLGLSVHLDNRRALRSYQRNGWERVLIEGVFTGQMRKPLF